MSDRFEQRSRPYRFDCSRCARTWTVTYTYRTASDDVGDNFEVFLLDGTPVPAPHEGVTCPHCGHDPVKGRPAEEASASASTGPPRRVAMVGGQPMIVLGRRTEADAMIVKLAVGTTKLELRSGPGTLPEPIARAMQAPARIELSCGQGLFDAGHWSEPRSILVWEAGGAWYRLAGMAKRELLHDTAGMLMVDAGLVPGPGRGSGKG